MTVEAVILPGYDLWMTFIKNVHVLPVSLDIQRFHRSLEVVLRQYPHASGRLRSGESHWSLVKLLQSPIPIQVVRLLGSPDAGLNDRRVIQDNIQEYLYSEQGSAGPAADDRALLLLKLTVAKTETAIGVSWHHTLGDAATLLRFMQALSNAYQGVPCPGRPTFVKHVFPAPSSQGAIAQYTPMMPHLARTYRQSELAAQYAAMNRDMARVDFRVAQAALEQLADMVRGQTGERGVSKQDCLTAYVVTVLNRCGEGPIDVVTNAASYRHTAAPIVDSEVAGNPIYIIRTELERGTGRLGSVALAIRRSIEKWREPSFITAYMSVASHLMLDAANADRSMFFAAEAGALSVNSTLSLDWPSVDFGYPGKARFHTCGVNDKYLRVFWGNPDLRAAESNDGDGVRDVEFSFGVSASARENVVDILATELGSPTFPAVVMHTL